MIGLGTTNALPYPHLPFKYRHLFSSHPQALLVVPLQCRRYCSIGLSIGRNVAFPARLLLFFRCFSFPPSAWIFAAKNRMGRSRTCLRVFMDRLLSTPGSHSRKNPYQRRVHRIYPGDYGVSPGKPKRHYPLCPHSAGRNPRPQTSTVHRP